MPAAVRSVATASHDTGTITCNKPAGTAVGDLLLAIVFRDEATGAMAVAGATFSTLASGTLDAGTGATTGGRIRVYTRTVDGSEPSSFTFTEASGNSTGTVHLFAITGGGTPVAATQNDTTSDVNMVAPTIASPGTDALLICAWDARCESTARTLTVPGSMSSAGQINPPANYIITIAGYEQLTGSAATGTRTATVSAAETSLGVSVAVPSLPSSSIALPPQRRARPNYRR